MKYGYSFQLSDTLPSKTKINHTSDANIRKALLDQLTFDADIGTNANVECIFSEFSVNQGDNRADIVTLGKELHAYEIKSDIDTLRRLHGQIQAYNQVFAKVTIVVGETHLLDIIDIIPEWWGIIIAKAIDGEISLLSIRTDDINPARNSRSVANLLSRNELDKAAREYGINGSNKSKQSLAISLSRAMNELELYTYVCETIRRRSAPSTGDELPSYDGLCRRLATA